jgi:hypothetical protein
MKIYVCFCAFAEHNFLNVYRSEKRFVIKISSEQTLQVEIHRTFYGQYIPSVNVAV